MGNGETGVTSDVLKTKEGYPGNGQVVDPAKAIRPGPHVMAASNGGKKADPPASRLQQPPVSSRTQHLQ